MSVNTLQSPVIVMGMARSGTTLLAEMIHKGGTPMFVDDGQTDPSYDGGLRYERRLTRDLNVAILGLPENKEAIAVLHPTLRPLPHDALARLSAEVGTQPWGFKNPRTTLTYAVWCDTFPGGPRLYTYRSHEEVLCHYDEPNRRLRSRWRRIRRAAAAWVYYNEQVLQNIRLDQAAGRPFVVVRYEELMHDESLIPRIEHVVGVQLCDARNWDLRRNQGQQGRDWRLIRLAFWGYGCRVKRIYQQLDKLRLSVCEGSPPR